MDKFSQSGFFAATSRDASCGRSTADAKTVEKKNERVNGFAQENSTVQHDLRFPLAIAPRPLLHESQIRGMYRGSMLDSVLSALAYMNRLLATAA